MSPGYRDDPGYEPAAGRNGAPNGHPAADDRERLRAYVREAVAAGICVLYPREDGTKAPGFVSPSGSGEWHEFQARRPTNSELKRWYGPHTGVGVVCGAVSGGLECYDFDDRATYEAFKAAAAAFGLSGLVERVEAGYLEESPSGGVHWLYYCESPACAKVAQRRLPDATGAGKSKLKTLIETKGEGGYVIIAPTFGRVHPSGRPYRRLGGSLATLVRLTEAERDAILALGRSFDQSPVPPAPEPPRAAQRHGGDWDDAERPGDDFNARASWAEILDGWTHVYTRGDTQYWRRPGKDFGQSATVNHTGKDRFHCFTSSSEFEPDQSYSKFGAYAHLHFRGDHQAAARALSERGYGTHKRWVKTDAGWSLRTFQNPCPAGERVARPGDPEPGAPRDTPPAGPDGPRVSVPTLGSLTDEQLGLVKASSVKPAAVVWEWPRRFVRGGMNVVAGEGGCGKSQITLSVVASVTRGAPFPDGSGPAVKGGCYVVSSEDAANDTIVPRLIAAGADLDLVTIVTADVRTEDGKGQTVVHPMSFQDLGYWRLILERGAVRVLVVDPLASYLGKGVDDHRNNEVRSVMTPFNAMCRELGVTFVAIMHTNKSMAPGAGVNRILGSVAYPNMARTAHITYPDPDDPARWFFQNAKSNLARKQGTLAYRIAGHDFEHDGEVIETSRVEFEGGTVAFDPATDLEPGKAGRPAHRPNVQGVKNAEWLHDFLFGRGWVPFVRVKEAAGELGMLGAKKPDGDYASLNPLYRAKRDMDRLTGGKEGFTVEDARHPVPGSFSGKALLQWRLKPPQNADGSEGDPGGPDEDDEDEEDAPF
jgi:hypothetical protein